MWATVREDIQSVLQRDPAAFHWLQVVLFYPGLHALWAHRVAYWLWQRHLRLPAFGIAQFARWLTGIEIHPAARIGARCFIDHGMGVFTAYHHFSRIDIQQGAMVTPGQQIGAVGETGLVTGPHLHWEVIVRGIEVDGLLWLQGREIGP